MSVQSGGVGASHRHRHRLLLLLGVGLCLLQPSAAAAAPEAPTIPCNVTREDGDTFRYQLSRPPALPGCVPGWEDENKTVIVHDKEFNKNLVQTVTNQSIITRSCWDYLHYTEDCPGKQKWSESHCRADCESLSEPRVSPRPSVTSPAAPPSDTWCRAQLTCPIIIVFAIAGAVVLGLIIWCVRSKWSKCKKRMNEVI